VVSFTPRQLYPQGKRPWYPLDRKLGGPQSRSGRGNVSGGEKKKKKKKKKKIQCNTSALYDDNTLSALSFIFISEK
jgi:hypothetical protein